MRPRSPSHQAINQDKHIGYVSLNTGNLEQATQFYHSLAGFSILKRDGNSTILGTAENYPLIILTEIEHSTIKSKYETGLDHFAILVPSRHELSKHFRVFVDHNYPINMVADHMVNESFYVHDPDGNLIEFTRDLTREEQMSHRPFSSNQLANILLTLHRPLQAHPFSHHTRIGHVLLRVTNLNKAEEFYTKFIGFNVSMRMPGAVFVAAGDYHHHVGFHVWESSEGSVPSKSTVGLRYFTIHVSSHESFLKINKTIQEVDSIISAEEQKIYLYDPSGNGILLTSKYDDHL